MKDIIRCAIYDRVSTDYQAENGISLDAQRKALTDYAVSKGYRIAGIYTDEGLTARKKMQNRKELLRLLEDVKADKIDIILVTKLDRWFRNIKDYHNTQAVLEAHNCNWKTIFEEYDTSTSNGRFAINIMLSVNENECDRDSDRIREVMRYKVSVGEITTPTLIYFGYKEENKHLVFDLEKENIVRDIYGTFLQNHSKHATYKYCLEKYGNLFSYQTFKHFFTAEIYKGKYRFNTAFCPAYLTPEEWDRVQEVNKKNIRVYDSGKVNNIYLFSGLIRCPECGRTLAGTYITQKNGRVMHYYRCWKFRIDKSCGNKKIVSELWLERYLRQNIVLEFERSRDRYRLAGKKAEAPAPEHNLAKCQKELDRLNTIFMKGRITEEKYDVEYLRIKKRMESAALEVPVQERDLSHAEALLNTDWAEMYESLDAMHRRSFWHGLIDGIELSDNKTVKSISFH